MKQLIETIRQPKRFPVPGNKISLTNENNPCDEMSRIEYNSFDHISHPSLSGWGGWEKGPQRKRKRKRKKKGISYVCGLDERGEQAKKREAGGSLLRNERMRRAYCTQKRSDRKEDRKERKKRYGDGDGDGDYSGLGRICDTSSGRSALFCNVTNP